MPSLTLSRPSRSQWVNPEPLVPVTPMCQSTMCPLSPLQVLSHSPSFELVTWNDKHAWTSSTPGAQIRMSFRGTKVGVFVYASHGKGDNEVSADLAVRKVEAPGQALCWIEEPDMTEAEWREKYGSGDVEDDQEGPAAAQTWVVTTHWPNKPAPQPEFVEMVEGLDPGEQCVSLSLLSLSRCTSCSRADAARPSAASSPARCPRRRRRAGTSGGSWASRASEPRRHSLVEVL